MTNDGKVGRRGGFVARGTAELVVIVVGVLIALWVEGWRETRIAMQSEVEYLQRLEEDLLADSVRLTDRIQTERFTMERAVLALGFAEGGWAAAADTAEVLAAYNFSGFVHFFVLETSTWDDLVSTGNLGLIRDSGLRARLGGYYRSSTLLLLLEMDDNRKQALWYRYRPALERYFPPMYLSRLSTGEQLSPFPQIDFSAMRADSELITGLKSAAGLAEVYHRNLGRLLSENQEVLRDVRAGLGDS